LTARDKAGQPAAFAIGWAVADELHLHDICVAPEFRGRGTGRRLLAAFLDAEHGEAVLEVRASNAPAIALYRSAGFVVAGCRLDYYDLPREDALVMVRPC
jgi:ribosomal-protein-alanine N-acetyltransferase